MKINPTRTQLGAGVVMGTKDMEAFTSFITRFLGINISNLTVVYTDLYSRMLKYDGNVQACKRLKQYYDISLRYAAGLALTPIPFCKSNKEGFPKALKAFGPFLKGSPNAKRAALTVLQLYKLIDCKADYSTTSITKQYLGSTQPWWLATFDTLLEEEFPFNELEERVASLKAGLHVSGKNGPNGPALITSPIDREAIRGTNIEAAVIELCQLTQNVYLDALLSESQEDPEEKPHHDKRDLVHSRLRIKYEPGGKSRLFAIVDYFSQSALKPIHQYLMKWLGNQPNDGTSSHSSAAKAVVKWTDGRFGKNLWSFDLTTATDRYPRFLEKRVIAKVFGEQIADAWERVISDREFLAPNGEYVRFNAGQPLGALSSWAAFAVTHHIHIRTAARLCLATPRYRIIGDDISIAKDLPIAQMYIGMMNDLDVPFSESKSILPSQMIKEPVAELAKRLFCNGTEITPIPPDAILEGLKTPIGLKNLIENCIDRGYDYASQIYPVQSAIPSQEWYPVITFPIRNRLPQISAVKLAFPIWEDSIEEPPFGFHRGWFTWSDYSDKDLEALLYEIIRKEVMLGYKKSQRMRNTLYEWSLIGPDIPVQGGDWQPEPWNLHMKMLPRIIDYMTERLEEILEEIATAPPGGDVYAYLGGIHSFIEPEKTFVGKDFSDEKIKTKVFITHAVKVISRILAAQDPIDALVKHLDEEV